MKLIVFERMPTHLRSQHREAGNWGIWPHNGAQRVITTLELAQAAEKADPDNYDHIVRGATSHDLQDYPRDVT